MLEAGAQLGAYSIVRPLGAGGMGVVYLARHRHIGRDAAIKVLLPELTQNEDIVARFLTEARATAAIRHPGIVEILDCDIDPTGRAYIVMEYLRGESLAQCLARAHGALSNLPSIVSVGGQIAGALAAAHARGIVHRDLKPDNVFLAVDGAPGTPIVVKILDFGIAKLITGNNEGAQNKTRTGSMLGTPAYMSPEQARDASAIDDRADIYALGCILFEMAAGRPPFVRPGAGEVMIAHVVELPPRLSTLAPMVDPALESLVAQMLEKDPAARPQTMSDVLTRLEALVGGRPAPLMTAIMPAVPADDSSPFALAPPTATSVTRVKESAAPRDEVAANLSASGRVMPRGTLVMPASHSTTMSDSAAEVRRQTTIKTVPLQKRRARAAAIGGGGAVVLALVAVFALRSGGGKAEAPAVSGAAAPSAPVTPVAAPPSAPPAPAPAPAPEPAVAAPKEVTIEVVSEPSGAEVWLPNDTAPRGRTPFKVALEPHAAPTRVILRARGYADSTVELGPEQPSPLSVTLQKVIRDRKRRSHDGYQPMGD
jgi:serine/threonine-protein kinase